MNVNPAAHALLLDRLAHIGAGRTGRVDLCRANDTMSAGRLVAARRIGPELAPEVLGIFDAAAIASSARHDNLVEPVGWGNDADGPYVATELVVGVSLARLTKTVFDTGESFPERLVVYIGACVGAGLAQAHAGGPGVPPLAHGDVWLGNVLAGFNGDVKVADLELAAHKCRLPPRIQRRPLVPLVAPPTDPGLDIQGLGLVLFDLLVGAGIVEPRDPKAVALTDPAALLFQHRPKLDPLLAHIVTRCVVRDADGRFERALDAATELAGWLVAHGYAGHDNREALSRFVRRNAMRQAAWFERAVTGIAPASPERPSAPKWSTASDSLVPPGATSSRESGETNRAAPSLDDTFVDEGLSDDTPGTEDDDAGREVPTVRIRMADLPTRPGSVRAPRLPVPPAPPAPPAPIHEPIADPESLASSAFELAEPATFDVPSTFELAASPEVVSSAPPLPATAALPGAFADFDRDGSRQAATDRVEPLAGHAPAPRADEAPEPSEQTDATKPRPAPPQPPAAPPPPQPAPLAEIASRPPAPAARSPGAPSPAVTPMRRPTPPQRPGAQVAPAVQRASGLPAAVTHEVLAAEIERLAAFAAKTAEEAKTAAESARIATQTAQRAALIARKASEAVGHAREAARFAHLANLTVAASRLERAHAVEASIRALEVSAAKK